MTGSSISAPSQISIAGVPVTAMRLSYVGEFGWELYTSADVSDTPLGCALGSRSGIRLIAVDVRRSTPCDWRKVSGPSVRYDQRARASTGGSRLRGEGPKTDDFKGKAALEARGAAATTKLTCLTLDRPEDVGAGEGACVHGWGCCLWGCWYAGNGSGKADGYVTSAAYGYSIGQTIAYAWLPNSLGVGDGVEIEYLGRRLPATVTA